MICWLRDKVIVSLLPVRWTVTHPCLYVTRWLHLVDDLHFLPQNVALAIILDLLASLQGEDEHDDQTDGDQEAKHHSDGLKYRLNH